MKPFILLCFVLFSFVVGGCQKTKTPPIPKQNYTVNYLHVSHTRTNTNPAMDSTIESLNFTPYDMVLLGGDLAWYTSEDNQTMAYVDSIFDLGNETTLWSLGNHDYLDLELIESYTKRPPFYAYYRNGITFLVLDTQDSLSSVTAEQLQLLRTIKDTIEFSSHLVVLHHKLIWLYGNTSLNSTIDSISNGAFGSCPSCLNPNNFYEDVFPLLNQIQANGVQVICVAGDVGKKVVSFEFETPEEIYFLASGIDANSTTTGKGLVFKHLVESKQLYWDFVALDEL